MEDSSSMDHRESKEKSTISVIKKKKMTEPGIIYLSRIPTLMCVKKVRQIFEDYGEVGRIFLQPDEKAPNNRRGRSFTEGWVEFKNKAIAKQVAVALNNNPVGGKKRSKWHDELWNIKYLHRFKWAHLNERLAYEKAVHEQRMRTEITQAKREASFHIQNAERTMKLKQMEKKMKKKGKDMEVKDHKDYQFKLRDTEEEIVEKHKRKLDSSDGKGKKKQKLDSGNLSERTLKKSFLTKIFSGGLAADSDEET